MMDKDRTDQSDRTDRVWAIRLDISVGFVTKLGKVCGFSVGLLFLLALHSSCSNEVTPSARTIASSPVNEVIAYITVVDSAGNPLAGMVPIVTRRPNAFDEPLATGAPTGGDGKGSVRFTSETKVYLRAWDPQLERFPNNYYDLLPGTGTIADGLEIVMLDAVTLEASLSRATGAPAAFEEIEVMLVHPSRGPWWPAKGRTDATGGLLLENLPPGKFSLRIEAASGGRLEVAEVGMVPGDVVDLGALDLQ